MWKKKEMPQIPGYETLGDSVLAKRFLDFKLNQLLDTGDPVWEFRGMMNTREDICRFVISQIDYPLHKGVPTDKHYNNWFDSNCCHCITQDYWQTASETLRTLCLNKKKGKLGIGDCEDVSCLFVTLMLEKKWEAYECLGYVLENDRVLGGHGFAIFQDDKKVWRLYEATLTIPPEYPGGYPEIDPESTEWRAGNLVYKAFAKFNRNKYYESMEELDTLSYYRLKFKLKETRKKYEAIATAWKQKAKPLKKLNLLSKIRWR